MRFSTRTSVGAIAVLAAALAVGLLPGAGRAQTPLFFPRTQTLDTSAYTLRMAGVDRYATAGALARVAADHQRTESGFPFNEADATAVTKAYGFGTCPRTVGIAAGDTVADALSAASVKDLGLLEAGGSGQRVDTTGINLLLTISARQGGFQAELAEETADTLSDLRSACGSFDILVFGGETAVPQPAFSSLQAIGDTTVRIVGQDRFDTAGKVALAVRGAKGATAVEIFTASETNTPHPNAVFLAEGFTGADALSAGPYLANKNVPVLLTETPKLPTATANALAALRPQNIIVLGGAGAVSNEAVFAAKRAAGIPPPEEGEEEEVPACGSNTANSGACRISGEDRYQTSIAIAQRLFDMRPPPSSTPIIGTPSDLTFSNQFVAVARSEGSGNKHVGFADALASAFFLDTASDIAVAPIRMAPPIETNVATRNEDGTFNPKVTIGGSAGPRRAPLYLVPQSAIPDPTLSHLAPLFPAARQSAPSSAANRANHGGFGFVFGGEAAVSRTAELRLAERLSGQTYTAAEDGPGVRTDLVPSMAPLSIYFTAMGFDGYTTPTSRGMNERAAFSEGDKICAYRGALKGSQWLAAYQAGSFAAAQDVDYENTESRIFCMDAVAVTSGQAQVLAFSLSGHETAPVSVDWSDSAERMSIDPPASDDRADNVTDGSRLTSEYSCTASLICSGGGKSSATFSGELDITFRGVSYTAAPYTLNLNFDRSQTSGSNNDTITYTGSFSVRDGTSLLFSANVQGETTGRESPFKLVGMYNTGGGKGGMRATVTTPAPDNWVLTDFVLDGVA
ncbi:MAG: cell wall-binding repeat-containing protein [Actinobacteria bacterium]|nr:cell wall-binding repeat-containing protein [Actinomycetota bacterium]